MDSIIIPRETILQQQTVMFSPFNDDIANNIQVIQPTNIDFKSGSIAGRKLNFQIPTGSYSIDVRNSYVELTMPLTYHFKPAANVVQTAWYINGQWFQQDYIDNDATTPTARIRSGEAYVVGTGPFGIYNIVQRTEFTGIGTQDFDDYKFQQLIYYMLKNQSTKNLDTWFVSDNPYNSQNGQGDGIIFFDGRLQKDGNILLKAAANALTTGTAAAALDPNFSFVSPVDYSVTVYKKFKLPLEIFNTVFMQESSGLFHANSVNANNINIQIDFKAWDLDKMMGVRCDDKTQIINTKTGVGLVPTRSFLALDSGVITSILDSTNAYACYLADARLILYTKQGQDYTSALRSRERIVNKLQDYDIQATNAIISRSSLGAQNFQVTSSQKTVQDIMLFLTLNDEQAKDSTRCHGIPTMYSAYDIVRILNSKSQDFITPYFDKLQIQINYNGQSMNLLNGDSGFRNPEMLKALTLQSLRMQNNFGSSGNQMFNDKLWKLFMHIIIINVESLRNNDAMDNIAGDNLDMTGRPLQISWQGIVNYSNLQSSGNNVTQPTSATNSATNGNMISFLGYETNIGISVPTNADLKVMFVYEKWSIMKPQENKLILTTDYTQAVPKPVNAM